MTIFELHMKLQELGIPGDNYFLHGLYGSADDTDKLSLNIKRGKYFIEYEIYYRDKGQKHSISTFTKEDDASDYFLKRMKVNLTP